MKITCYTWTMCQHTEHVSEEGLRVGYDEVHDKDNQPIFQERASYSCPACSDPHGDHNGIGIRPILQASANLAASPALAAQPTSSFDPQVLAFQPAVAQSHNLPSGQPFVAHSNDPYSDQNADSHHNGVYSNSSTVSQNNGFYPNPPTHPQYNSSHSSSFPGYGLYTAAMHDARNNFTPSGNDSIDHAAPYGAFNAAATEPTPFSTAHAHTHNHTHGHDHVHSHVHATERQGTTCFGYSEGDVEGLIISDNALGNHSRNHNYVPTESVMPYNHFTPAETTMPYNPSLARQNAAKAAVLKKDEHKPGQPCPDNHPYCHWHYARWCHEDPVTCRSALQAITAAFYAHGAWKDAPLGWNQIHEPCVRAVNAVMCAFHSQLKRRIYGSSFDQ